MLTIGKSGFFRHLYSSSRLQFAVLTCAHTIASLEPDPHSFQTLLMCSGPAQLPVWRLVNGLWGLVLGLGLLYTSMVLRTARSWRFGPAWIRGFLADYGVRSFSFLPYAFPLYTSMVLGIACY
jgi:hypothetical protein